ncbi:MAG: hypothetical protein ABFE13_13440 [Phycisphaerales bacterium]
METSSFEQFPWWMVVTCNAVGVAIYAIGLCLMFRLRIVWGVLYLAYCLWMEWRLLSGSCRSCYYYGKRCGFGKGRLCSWLLTRRAKEDSSKKPITWRDVAPDFLVSLIPLVVGIVLLIRDFSWPVLALVLILVLLGSVGTGFVRGQIACRYCKQRELGCPAEQLFSKTKPTPATP